MVGSTRGTLGGFQASSSGAPLMAGKRASDGPPPCQQRQSLILVYLNSIK